LSDFHSKTKKRKTVSLCEKKIWWSLKKSVIFSFLINKCVNLPFHKPSTYPKDFNFGGGGQHLDPPILSNPEDSKLPLKKVFFVSRAHFFFCTEGKLVEKKNIGTETESQGPFHLEKRDLGNYKQSIIAEDVNNRKIPNGTESM